VRRPPRLASDVELVALAHGGCDDSFGELARRHRAALVRACLRLVGADLAEDAAQQALLKALVALRSDATPPAQIRPWLLRVAHNASVDMLRRQALESGDASDAEGMDGRCPADVLEGRRELRAVLREIGRLPERQRQALLLRALEGHGYEEIARALGASEGMVRQLIYRARERVRAAAAAVLVPIWLLRRSAPALKVAAATGAAATGAVVVGGVTAGSQHHGVAHAAVVEAPPVHPDRLPKVVAPAPLRHPHHRSAGLRRGVHKRVTAAAPKPAPQRKVVAPRKAATAKPAPQPRPHRTAHLSLLPHSPRGRSHHP
jgi:RNA polymerase sigma factor (sigma-70 family)